MELELIVTDIRQDLRPFSDLLWQRGIAHRIHESAGRQVLSIDNAAMANMVQELYRRFSSGQLAPAAAPQASSESGAVPEWQVRLLAAPVTLVLVIACIIGGLIVFSGRQEWISLLTFQSWFELGGARFYQPILETLQAGQWWRLWTPIFLHFGMLHLVFNGLWLWEFGRRVEVHQGAGRLLLLVLLIGLGSNCIQYLFARNITFGGMSGVVYGLVGYCWGWSLLRPGQDFGIPKVLVYAMLGLMVLALTGIFSLFGFGAVANAAHFSGFLIGLLVGLLLASFSRGQYGLSKTH
jgi:GlpG protein